MKIHVRCNKPPFLPTDRMMNLALNNGEKLTRFLNNKEVFSKFRKISDHLSVGDISFDYRCPALIVNGGVLNHSGDSIERISFELWMCDANGLRISGGKLFLSKIAPKEKIPFRIECLLPNNPDQIDDYKVINYHSNSNSDI